MGCGLTITGDLLFYIPQYRPGQTELVTGGLGFTAFSGRPTTSGVNLLIYLISRSVTGGL